MSGVCNFERLLNCDKERHFMSYNLEENHLGWKGYVAKAQVNRSIPWSSLGASSVLGFLFLS